MSVLSRKAKIGFAALALGALVIIGAVAMPWRPLLETQIKAALEARGFQNVQLTLSTEEPEFLSFKDIQLGAPAPLSIKSLAVAYAPLAFLKGKTGDWQVKDLMIQNDDFPLPALNGNGTIFAQSDHVTVQGQFESADHTHKLSFKLDYSFRDPDRRELMIVSAVMPWNGGTVATKDVKIRLEDRQVLDVKLTLDRVSADALMQQLTGKKATATGAISGTLPVTIDKEGSIGVHKGALQAQEPGTITLSPDVIPGDNPQVDFVREVMKNFHYSLFSVHLDSDENHRLAVLMTVHGHNPAVQSGRLVELNVHLTGDMLNFLRQNLIWLSDPRKLLERGQNENK